VEDAVGGDFVAFGTGAERIADEEGFDILDIFGIGKYSERPTSIGIISGRRSDLFGFDETDNRQSPRLFSTEEESQKDFAIPPPASEGFATLESPLLVVQYVVPRPPSFGKTR
jgi:hypothetical protein